MTQSFNFNLTGIPHELHLLLEYMKKNNKEEINESIKKDYSKINWDLFNELAIHHRIYPLIYKRSKHTTIPKRVVDILFNKYQKNIFRMMHLSAETENLSKLFQNNNISSIFLKGPVLAEDLYDDISLRTSSDLDILIPIKELNKADKYLTELGYIKDDYIHTVLNDWKWRHHHFTYFHPVKMIKAEIHWRLNPGPAKEPPFRDLWKRKRTSHLTNFPIYLLGKEDMFLFLVSHGARHGWSRLRWLTDIDRLIRKGIDIKKTVKLLKKYQYLHIGGQAIFLTSYLLNTPLTEDFRKIADTKRSRKLAQDAIFYFKQQINLHSEPVSADVAIYHKKHLYALMSFQQKIMFSLSVLYPYPIDAETFPLPKTLHFLYFALHPLLWAFRKLRKQALP